MNKHYFFLLLLSAITIISCDKDCPEEVTTPGTNVNLTAGLLAYFPFNGNTNDASGKNNNGTLVGGSTLTYDENGKLNSALNCGGNNQKMVVQNNGSIVLDTAMTISFNAMPRTATNPAYLSMVDNTTGKGPSFLLGTYSSGNSFLFSLTNNDVACTSIQTASQVSNLISGIVLQPEAWYNVICTFRAGVMKLYINGNLVGTQNSANTTMHNCPNAQLIVGGWWDGDPASSFNGKLDEVRMYNRVINSDEINELAKSFK